LSPSTVPGPPPAAPQAADPGTPQPQGSDGDAAPEGFASLLGQVAAVHEHHERSPGRAARHATGKHGDSGQDAHAGSDSQDASATASVPAVAGSATVAATGQPATGDGATPAAAAASSPSAGVAPAKPANAVPAAATGTAVVTKDGQTRTAAAQPTQAAGLVAPATDKAAAAQTPSTAPAAQAAAEAVAKTAGATGTTATAGSDVVLEQAALAGGAAPAAERRATRQASGVQAGGEPPSGHATAASVQAHAKHPQAATGAEEQAGEPPASASPSPPAPTAPGSASQTTPASGSLAHARADKHAPAQQDSGAAAQSSDDVQLTGITPEKMQRQTQGADPASKLRLVTRPLNDTINGLLRVAARGGAATARIVLTPPELGSVEIRLRVRGSTVTAELTADSSHGAQALGQSVADLRRSLEAQGLIVQGLDVRQSGPDGGASSWQGQGNSSREQERAASALAPDETEIQVAVTASARAGEQVDVLA
jgi:flagellar hook-length control protein FliK